VSASSSHLPVSDIAAPMTSSVADTTLATTLVLAYLFSLLYSPPVVAQSNPPGLAQSDTVRTSTNAALWQDSSATVFEATIPPGTPVVIYEVDSTGVVVSSKRGDGWIHKRALKSTRSPRSQARIRTYPRTKYERRRSQTGRRYSTTHLRSHRFRPRRRTQSSSTGRVFVSIVVPHAATFGTVEPSR